MKKRFLLSSLLALSIIGCSTPMINTSQDFTDLEKEYKSFSTKALSNAYVQRMFNKYLTISPNSTQVIRQLEFSRYLKNNGDSSYETSLKSMFSETPALYNTMTGASAPDIQNKMSTESATFGTFVIGISPYPASPTGLSADNISSSGFIAHWNAVNGATSYEIVTDNTAPVSVASNSYNVSGLTGMNHTFKVRAVNISGAGAYSSQIDVTLLPASPPAGIILVNASATGLNNGSSWANAYTSLQSALSVATSGKDIWVASGTYKPGTSRSDTFQLKSGVNIYGGFAGNETDVSQRNFNNNIVTLSCDISGNDSDVKPNATTLLKTDNCYHVVKGATGATLDGVTIKFGYANGGSSPDNQGGGMYNNASSSPTVSNVIFSYNFATNYGGGMYNYNSSPPLTNVTFSNNYSNIYGGGLYSSISTSTLTNVTFSSNSANNSGAGMFNNTGTPTLSNVTFSGNAAASYGGGLYNGGTPILSNVIFSNNSAPSGGGGLFSNGLGAAPTLTNVTFYGNTTNGHGGGMYSSTVTSLATLTNVVFASNSSGQYGGGLAINDALATLTNVTFSGNTATTSGKSLYSSYNSYPTTVTAKNSIFWGTSSPQIYQSSTSSTLKIENSDVQGGFAGITGGSIKDLSGNTLTSGNFASVGNINSNPNFVNTSDLAHLIGADGIWMTSDDGLYLQSSSPARNTGTNTGAPAADIIGTSRPKPVGGNVDMGAYEFIE